LLGAGVFSLMVNVAQPTFKGVINSTLSHLKNTA
jgi:hypothetical protein